jgi:hypothetical protein
MHLLLQRINHPRTFQQHHRHIWNTGGRRNLPNERKPRSFVNQQYYPDTPTIFTDLSSTAINNEFITIYDSATSSTAYNYNRYVDATYTAGKALTLVGYGSEQGDISSGTFLSITNTNGVGIGIVGGSDPEHIDEPFSTTGLFINKELKEATTAAAVLVSTNYYIPIQTAVMGTSHSHNRVSLGINTTNPSRDLFLRISTDKPE